MDRRSFSERLFRLFSLFFCLLSFPPLGSFPFPMPVFPRLLSMRILFRADSFPCFYSSVFVRFGASGSPVRFRYVFSRISPGPPPASLPSSFGSAFPVSGFRLRLVLSRIIRLHVWRYVSRRGLRGTTMPTAQAVPVAHAAASADRAEPENRPERPLPSGPKLRAAAASVLPSGGADTGRPSRVRSIRLPVAAGTAEAVRHGAVSTAQGCSVSFFTL